MTGVVNFVMAFAVSVGSMVMGVLAAYGVLRAGFALMRPQRQSAVKNEAQVAEAQVVRA